MRLHFLIPGDINTLTGGYVYNKYIIEGLKTLGYVVNLHQLAGDFPFPSKQSMVECYSIFSDIPAREPIFIDSLAFGPMHKIIGKYFGKNPVIAIMHLPLPKNPNFSPAQKDKLYLQEKNSLGFATCIVAVSEFTKQLILDYGIDSNKIVVINPGVIDIPRKATYPNFPKNLLCVGSYLPGKGQLLLIQALSELIEMKWTLAMYGIQDFDANYVKQIQNSIEKTQLTERVFMNPPIAGKVLTNAYLHADLFVLPSLFENFSMALNDALYCGIPVVTTDGGGIPFSVPKDMGVFVPKGNAKELKYALANILTDSMLYKNLYVAASNYYKTANTWEKSIKLFHTLIQNFEKE